MVASAAFDAPPVPNIVHINATQPLAKERLLEKLRDVLKEANLVEQQWSLHGPSFPTKKFKLLFAGTVGTGALHAGNFTKLALQ